MSNFIPRLKAIIGSLKPLAIIVAILAAVLLFLLGSNLLTAVRNISGPQTVTIGQLVKGEVGRGQYVTVSGVAEYNVGYTETEDGRTVADYYFLVDTKSGSMVLVKSEQWVRIVDSESVTISGVTHRIPSDLKGMMEDDLPEIEGAGLETTTRLYIGEEEIPPSLLGALAGTVVSGGALLASLVTFLVPSTVFLARPLEEAAVPPGDIRDIKASGRFQKLKSVKPTIEVGKGHRKLNRAVANLVPLGEGQLMVYIHHIMRTKTYGITVSKKETDWAVFLEPAKVDRIQTGTLYGWKNRPALQVGYRDPDGKTQELTVSFENPESLAGSVELLQRMGFSIRHGA
jgi:hypothetical protein